MRIFRAEAAFYFPFFLLFPFFFFFHFLFSPFPFLVYANFCHTFFNILNVRGVMLMARKQKLRDCALKLLDTQIKDKEITEGLLELGLDKKDMTYKMALVYMLCRKAVLSGDVSAYREIRSTLGDDSSSSDEVFSKLDKVLKFIKGSAK